MHTSRIIRGRKGKAFNDETMAKLRKANPIKRPEVQGSTYRPLKVDTNANHTAAGPCPFEGTKPEIKINTTNDAETKRLAAQHKPQPKAHANKPTPPQAKATGWTAEQKKAWRKANKANPTHTIYFN